MACSPQRRINHDCAVRPRVVMSAPAAWGKALRKSSDAGSLGGGDVSGEKGENGSPKPGRRSRSGKANPGPPPPRPTTKPPALDVKDVYTASPAREAPAARARPPTASAVGAPPPPPLPATGPPPVPKAAGQPPPPPPPPPASRSPPAPPPVPRVVEEAGSDSGSSEEDEADLAAARRAAARERVASRARLSKAGATAPDAGGDAALALGGGSVGFGGAAIRGAVAELSKEVARLADEGAQSGAASAELRRAVASLEGRVASLEGSLGGWFEALDAKLDALLQRGASSTARLPMDAVGSSRRLLASGAEATTAAEKGFLAAAAAAAKAAASEAPTAAADDAATGGAGGHRGSVTHQLLGSYFSGTPVKLWVGSWNVGAKEPFEGADASKLPELDEFVGKGFDVYVLGVQEGVSDAVYEHFAERTGTIRLDLNSLRAATAGDKAGRGLMVGAHALSTRQLGRSGKAKDMHDRVLGRGDGSFREQKFTGIAAFVSPAAAEYVHAVSVNHHSFGATEGSKGGAGVVLKIHDTTIAFVNCHLASKKYVVRYEQYKELCRELGAKLGHPSFQLNEQFHHVVWMGDLNYRTTGLTTDEALLYMSRGEHLAMRDAHDELTLQKREMAVYHGYVEPEMAPDFLPTYKKFEDRPPVSDYTVSSWVRDVYRVEYKEPMYKGGRVKTRLPGWCDRIQFHSLRHLSAQLVAGTRIGTGPDGRTQKMSTYRSINDVLTTSDHSPVCCTFRVKMRPDAAGGDGSSPVRVMLRIVDIEAEENTQLKVPHLVKVLFPAPFEMDDNVGTAAKSVRESDGLAAAISCDAESAVAIVHLHTVLKVQVDLKDKSTKGHCVVSLRVLAEGLNDAGYSEARFFEPMYNDGVPCTGPGGRPLHMQFRMSMQLMAVP